MRVLVTGAGGQLGTELARAAWPATTDLVALTSRELDITKKGQLGAAFDTHTPDIVINTAAYTAVDLAESDEATAMAVNADAVDLLAKRCDDAGAFLVHLSTDYVFDGTASGWYLETDPVNPSSAYGRSKAAGEAACLSGTERSLVVRTSWVYGAHGPNFVATMLRLARERDELGVVADQVGCPTATSDLAAALIDLATLIDANAGAEHRIVHVAAPDATTWFELATAALATSKLRYAGTITPLTTEQYPTAAARPANSRLDTGRLHAMIGRRLPPWRDTLPSVVGDIESMHWGDTHD